MSHRNRKDNKKPKIVRIGGQLIDLESGKVMFAPKTQYKRRDNEETKTPKS